MSQVHLLLNEEVTRSDLRKELELANEPVLCQLFQLANFENFCDSNRVPNLISTSGIRHHLTARRARRRNKYEN